MHTRTHVVWSKYSNSPSHRQDMMGQGMCCGDMCMTPEAASMTSGPLAPLGMMRMMGEGHMDARTRGRMLQLQGELLKAMGEVMIKHGQAMNGEQ
jgi:hypothetical protein